MKSTDNLGYTSKTVKVHFMGLFLLLWKSVKINILWPKMDWWYYMLWFMSFWHLDKSIFPGGFLSLNVYPKFSVEFSWVKRRCSYHRFYANYSPINHPFAPSKNLYFRENFGSKFVGDDNLIFHAVYRITDENGKNYLSGRVWGRGLQEMISSFFWGGIGR